MDDLEVFANKLKNWRIEHPRGPYPKHIWNEIKKLAEQHPIFLLSQKLGIQLTYLQQKLIKNYEPVTFAPLKATSFSAPVSIEFTDHKVSAVSLHFHANLEEITHMILS